MSRYLIPNYKMNDLQRQIQRIRNKGAQVTFEVINDHVAVPAESVGRNMTLDCSEVEVEGKYQINGWTFVGTIEHATPTNIIRFADLRFEDRVPERYRTAARDCEHCHIRRDRNDTYLVYNEDNDEFKQVGRTCLKGYTNGLDAEACANLVSVMREIIKLNNQAENDEFDSVYLTQNCSAYLGYPMSKARKQAYKYVESNGYVPGRTGQRFAIELTQENDLPEATDEEVQAVTDWLENSEVNGWQRNALAAWTKGQYQFRDAGLITSAVSGYLKWKEKEAARAAREAEQAARNASMDNTFAGEVGDSVTFTIREFKVIYWRTGGPAYHSNEYPVYRIIGTDNKVYIWGSSSTADLNVGDTLKGRVKKQITRPNGEKQTEVTRCRITTVGPNGYRGFFHD